MQWETVVLLYFGVLSSCPKCLHTECLKISIKKNKCKIVSLGTLEIWYRPPAPEAHASHPRRLAPGRGGLIRQISHVVPQSSAPVTGLAGLDHKQRIYTGQFAWQRKYKHSHSECTHHVLWSGLPKWRDISPNSIQRELLREVWPRATENHCRGALLQTQICVSNSETTRNSLLQWIRIVDFVTPWIYLLEEIGYLPRWVKYVLLTSFLQCLSSVQQNKCLASMIYWIIHGKNYPALKDTLVNTLLSLAVLTFHTLSGLTLLATRRLSESQTPVSLLKNCL